MIGMDFIHPREVGERTIFTRWWFWIGIVVLAAGAWFARVHFLWQGETAQYGAQNALANAYMQMQEKKAADLKAAYQADTYGGATPEETLRLFVEALEKKDYVLASKYYRVEDQSRALQDLEAANTNDHIETYMAILNGAKEGVLYTNRSTYEFRFFDDTHNQIHVEQLMLNSETKTWKLTEL
jgi:hypothetical protein